MSYKVATNVARSEGFHLHGNKDSTDEEDDEENEEEDARTLRSTPRQKLRQELHVTVSRSTEGPNAGSHISPSMMPSPVDQQNKACRVEGLLQCTAPQTASSVEESVRG